MEKYAKLEKFVVRLTICNYSHMQSYLLLVDSLKFSTTGSLRPVYYGIAFFHFFFRVFVFGLSGYRYGT